MKTQGRKYFCELLIAWLSCRLIALAGGVVSTCDEASLRAALAGGGTVTFACDGTLLLSNSLVISNNTLLDASGHSVSLSGGKATRHFVVQAGFMLTLQNLTLINGLAQGTNGNPGVTGGSGNGGSIDCEGGIVNALNCAFLNNVAQGGTGGDAAQSPLGCGGTGGQAIGAVAYLKGGAFNATNCTLSSNEAIGGNGGNTGGSCLISYGGDAMGGMIFNQGGTLHMECCQVCSNQTVAGQGRRYSVLGASWGGKAWGGALGSQTAEVSLVRCTLSTNFTVAGSDSVAYGGAIYQDGGNLRARDTILGWNSSLAGHGLQDSSGFGIDAAPAFGGGLALVSGSAWLTNCTLVGNLAQGGDGNSTGAAGSALGGGLYNSGAMTAINSTVYGNTVLAGTPPFGPQGSGLGGGICNNGGSLSLDYVTVAQNNAIQSTGGQPNTGASLGGGIESTNGVATIHATIIANNLSGSNGFGSFVDAGYNLSGDASFHFTGTGSLNGVDAKLGPLGNYGGRTLTVPLLAGSSAIDAGDSALCQPTDQRGRARPYGAGCDIGAFESSAPFTIRGIVSGKTLQDVVTITDGSEAGSSGGGQYEIDGVAPGSYTVTPVHSNYVFVPANLPVTVGPDQLNVNFKAYHINMLTLEDASAGVLHQVFAGTNGRTYSLMTSSNLMNWSLLGSYLMGPSNYVEIAEPILPGLPQFYRMSWNVP